MKKTPQIRIILSHPSGYLLIWITLFGLIALIGSRLSPHVSSIGSELVYIILLHFSAIFSVAVALFVVVGAYRISHLEKYSSHTLKIMILPVVVVFVLTMFLVRAHPSVLLFIMLNGIMLLTLAFLVGELLSREVLHAGHLIPVAAVLTLVDFWSVSQGPSSKIVDQTSEFIKSGGYAEEVVPPFTSFLLLNFPQIVTADIYSFIGVGDLVIIAFFIGCIYRFNLPVKHSIIALILGPIIAVMTANILNRGIPALPIIALLFILFNIRNLSMRRQDIIISVIVILALFAITALWKFF